MPATTVIFVHGFTSSPDCWKPFLERLKIDTDITSQGFSFLCFKYPTRLFEWKITRRIPSIEECGASLGDYIDNEAPEGELMLVGHSMGGLVIQSFLAGRLAKGCGESLERIRSVIMFATPNRGSTIVSSAREILGLIQTNDQEKDLQVLSKEVAATQETIVDSLIQAQGVDSHSCPIPFRVFWGLEDSYVPEVSARGSFVEASPLPGNHTEILKPNSDDPRDQRYIALKNALLNPIGHPSIYEISRLEVNLCISPSPIETPILLKDMQVPLTIYADNIAVREIRLTFSKQNRCHQLYEQMYRSKDGYVQLMTMDGNNEAPPAARSEYRDTGKKYSFQFRPGTDCTYGIKLKIFKGFGDGQRNWHNHMPPNARVKLFSFTLDLRAYHDAGWQISPEPVLYMHPKDNDDDHDLCDAREPGDILAPLSPSDPWLRKWEIANVRGGVIDIAWDIKKPA